MKQTSTPFLTQLEHLFNEYSNYCSASALFYTGHNPETRATCYGLRLEAPSIAREFTSNVYFGRDPEGLLFYYTLSDFNTVSLPQKATKYHCFYNTENTISVRVDFHAVQADGAENEKPFCTFITRNTDGLTDKYLQTTATDDGSGNWHDAHGAFSYAKVYKDKTSQRITVTIDPIGKQICFNTSCEGPGPIGLMGTFTYFEAKELNAGESKLRADCNNGRIVFYDYNDQGKMIAFFTPVESIIILTMEATRQPATIKDIRSRHRTA